MEGGGGEPAPACEAVETEPLFSATTFNDFSKTFQSLIVLSDKSKGQLAAFFVFSLGSMAGDGGQKETVPFVESKK